MSDLYEDMFYKHELITNHPDYEGQTTTWSIELRFIHGADCKIGNFGINRWYRTRYGMQYKTYKNEKTMRQAVEQSMRKHGYTIHGWTA